MCSTGSYEGKIRRFFNTGTKSELQQNSTIGLSNVNVTNANGVLRCQFNRTKYIAVKDYFSLFSPWYVLLAKGSLSESECEDFVNFQNIFYLILFKKIQNKIMIPINTEPSL